MKKKAYKTNWAVFGILLKFYREWKQPSVQESGVRIGQNFGLNVDSAFS